MNLTEMLSYADIYDLNRIAKNYACECNGNSKNELIQSILIAINQKDTFEEQMNALTIEDIRLLNFLVFNQRSAYSLEDLLARIKQTKFEAKEGVISFLVLNNAAGYLMGMRNKTNIYFIYQLI
jgi:hypothetical protein